MRKVGRSHLRFDDRPGEQPLASEDVLVEELDYDVLNVLSVELVDDTIDTLPQHLPHQPLMLG